MRAWLTVIFLFLALAVGAEDFFADSRTGLDTNDGLTPETAFKTLGRLDDEAGKNNRLFLVAGSVWTGTPGLKAEGIRPLSADTGTRDASCGYYLHGAGQAIVNGVTVVTSMPTQYSIITDPTYATVHVLTATDGGILNINPVQVFLNDTRLYDEPESPLSRDHTYRLGTNIDYYMIYEDFEGALSEEYTSNLGEETTAQAYEGLYSYLSSGANKRLRFDTTIAHKFSHLNHTFHFRIDSASATVDGDQATIFNTRNFSWASNGNINLRLRDDGTGYSIFLRNGTSEVASATIAVDTWHKIDWITKIDQGIAYLMVNSATVATVTDRKLTESDVELYELGNGTGLQNENFTTYFDKWIVWQEESERKDLEIRHAYETFEADFSDFWDVSTATLASATTLDGTGSVRFGPNTRLRKTDIAYKNVRMSMDFFISTETTASLATHDTNLAQFSTASNTAQVRLQYNTAGMFDVQFGLTGGIADATTVPWNTWVHMDLIHDNRFNQVAVRINGVTVATAVGDSFAGNLTTVQAGNTDLDNSLFVVVGDNLEVYNAIDYQTVIIRDNSGNPVDTNSVVEIGAVDDGITVSQVAHYVVDGLVIAKFDRHGLLGNFSDEQGGFLISNNTFENNGVHGMTLIGASYTSPSSGNIITGNTFRLNGDSGVTFGQSVQSSTISYNVAEYNVQYEYNDWSAHYRTVPAGEENPQEWQKGIDNWIIYNIGRWSGIDPEGNIRCNPNTAGDGVWMDTSGRSFVIGNYMWNCVGASYYNEAGSEVLMENNIGILSRAGIEYNTNKALGVTDSTAANNMIGHATYGGEYGGHSTNTTTLYFERNTLRDNITFSNKTHGLFTENGADNDGTQGQDNVYTGNWFGVESTGFLNNEGTTYDTYAAYEAGTGLKLSTVSDYYALDKRAHEIAQNNIIGSIAALKADTDLYDPPFDGFYEPENVIFSREGIPSIHRWRVLLD